MKGSSGATAATHHHPGDPDNFKSHSLEENALHQHGRGNILGVLRRALTPVGRACLLRIGQA
jgi:hypothetical protein